MRFIPYTLQGKFLAGLVLILFIMGALFTYALRVHTQEILTSEASEKANLMLAHTEAIQNYVRKVLRPAVSKVIAEDDFIIEAMSTSFVTRHILSSLSIDSNSFTYRRVAKNARNPDYEVAGDEIVFFNKFLANKSLSRIEQTLRKNGTPHLIIARPVYFTQDCLRCHGMPEDAPKVLLQKYGATSGFYRHAGELAGLDMISVPLENTTGAVSRSITMFAVWFSFGMIFLLCLIQIFFNRLVVHNLRRVGAILQRIFFQEGNQELLAPLQKEEEIEGMVKSIEAVATHLGKAREQLSEHSKNLENIVHSRTADLERMVQARSADVALFINLLSGLNHNHEKKALLSASLELIARHFGAEQALYACALSGSDFTTWSAPTAPSAPPQHQSWQQFFDKTITPTLFVTLEKPLIVDNYWILPVQTTAQTRGVLGLFWNSTAALPPERKVPLALAFARQLGIALDNLEVLDTLLHQNTLLDSLVEGVPDPLILLEANGTPIIANSSARALARSMTNAPMHEQEDTLAPQILLAEAANIDNASTNGQLTALLENLAILSTNQQRVASAPIQQDVIFNKHAFVVGTYPLTPRTEGIQRTIIHIREVTEEKQLMEHLRRSEKLAVVGQLAAGLAHEINNPLGVIRCYAELLSANVHNEQEKADIEVILKHVESAQSVLRDLLDFSRPKATKLGPCNVQETLTSLVELFKPKALSAKVTIALQTEQPLQTITADAGMLEQALINLLLNALDAVAPSTGVITVSAHNNVANNTVSICVADNGTGIAPSNLAKIFDPFFSTKTKGAGTGLGLTVAFGIVREMGGSLEVVNLFNNATPCGVQFTVTLPITTEEAAE